MYFDDLTQEQRSYLTSAGGRKQVRDAAEQGGFVLEERADGMLAVDTEAIATDSKFPDDASTAKVAALLLLDQLAGSPAATAQLESVAAGLLARFPRWAMTYRDAHGPVKLLSDAVAVLAEFGLARCDGELVTPLPAAARYTVGTVRTPEPREELNP